MHDSDAPAGAAVSDPRRRALMRIEHWIGHNENHLKEYERFARELESLDALASAEEIRAMAKLTRQSTLCLQRALAALA